MDSRNRKTLQNIIYSASSVLFPPRCIGCDEILEPWERENGVCSICIGSGSVHLATEPVCRKCGKPISDASKELCSDCTRRSHAFRQARAVFFYEGEVKTGMYRFKYSGRRCYGRIYAQNAVKLHKRWLRQIKPDVIIPVPMYKPKERARGYNQAAVFARALSVETGISYRDDVLIRNRNTLPQKLLGLQDRQKNLKNAFQIKDFGVKLNHVLLVDDIYTTGATADEAARALLAAGAEDVSVMTVCVGES